MKKFVALLGVLLILAGCAQCSSFFDGFTGQPMDQHTDLPGWYHAGALSLPVISQLVAILRIVLPLIFL